MENYTTNIYKMTNRKKFTKPFINKKRFGITAKRGKIAGTHKIQTPRLLLIFLKAILPSKTLSRKNNESLIVKLDDNWLFDIKRINEAKEKMSKSYKFQQIKLIDNEKIIQEAVEGYLVSMGGYLNITALDVLLLIIDDAVENKTQKIRFTIRNLLKRLNKNTGGDNYQLILEQIQKLAKIGFVFSKEQIFLEKKYTSFITGLQLFQFFTIERVEYKKHETLDLNVSTIEFRLTDEFFASIQKFGLIDSSIYKNIKEPSLKLLYVYLCLMDHNQRYMKRKGKDLLGELNIKIDRNYKIKLRNLISKIAGKTMLSMNAEYDNKNDIILFKY